MTWAPDYASATELKSLVLRVGDTDDDVLASLVVTAASRAIDQECNRQFGLTGSAVPRLYTWGGEYIDGCPALPMDDLATTVGLVLAVDSGGDNTYATTLTINTDYDLWPYNAAAEGKPWTHVLLRAGAVTRFPWVARGVQITGNWGWIEVPAVVKNACLIQAGRFFMRRDSLYGVAGSPDLGNEMRLLARLDPDVALLLSSVKRHWGAV